MPATHLPDYSFLRTLMQEPRFLAVWNSLIPKADVRFEHSPDGVRYLHATKGWRFVGKRRFAVRGVM